LHRPSIGRFRGTPAVERYEVGRETLVHPVAFGFRMILIGGTGIVSRYPEVFLGRSKARRMCCRQA
jgi:hypothetical protein